MNPCPCGHAGSLVQSCRCTPEQISRYQGRLSGPFLDRLDLLVEVPVLPAQVLADASGGEASSVVAARVARARELALARQGCSNARLSVKQLDGVARIDQATTEFMHKAANRLAWSARSYHRVLRVARTVADLEGSADIAIGHLSEAIQWRRGLGRVS